ncbi:MAG: 6-bladed beta-propeller [Acidimicrobiia bacterium]
MRVRIATVVFLLLFGAGCGIRPRAETPALPTEPLVWPKSPAKPRIRYVGRFAGPHDLAIEKSFLRRLAERLFGTTEEYLVRPTGVAEHDGVLYVADPGAQALWIFDRAHRRFLKVGWVAGQRLGSPVAIAVRAGGGVFVADSWLKKVFLLDEEGKLLRTVVRHGLKRPAALAYDEDTQRLYVADSAAHRIVVYGADGGLVSAWGRRGNGDGEFNFPTHLALGRSGTLFVTDALNFRIQAFNLEGRFLWKMGWHGDGSGDFAAPKGVAADGQGHLYVVDALFDAVQIFKRDGTFLLAFGERGIRPGQFWLPGGIFLTRHGRIYVADSYNQRVQIFDLVLGSE